MFGKVTVSVGPGREYIAYVNGNELEIVACIDGNSAHIGSARWDGTKVRSGEMHLRDDARNALSVAIARATESVARPHD